MEKVNRWEDLEPSRKSELLNHWFYYYGGTVVTFDEIERFNELAKTNADDIFNYIVTSFIFDKTIQTNVLVGVMRSGEVKKFFEAIINYAELDEAQKKKIDPIRCSLLDEIEHTYAAPEPPVPMDIAIIVEDGPKLGGKK